MRYVWLCLTGLTVATPPVVAQLSARADVSTGGRYVWHGISRAAGLVAQPSVAVGFRVHSLSLESGAVPTRLDAGVVRYVFRGDSGTGGLGPARSTTEVYAAYSVTSSYINPSLEAWWDVERVRGVFLRAAFDLPVLGWPFPPYAFAFVQGDLGLNVGQGPNAARPGELANFADRGITHVGLGMGAEMRARRLSGIGLATLAVGVRSQLNLDDATRFNGTGRNRDFSIWLWTGITVVVGGDARERR